MSEHTQTTESAWLSDYSAGQIMAAISAALKAKDMPAVAALMPALAVKDPMSAQMVLDTLTLAGGHDE